MTKRILFLSEKGGFCGGVEKFIFQAAQTLRAQGVYCIGLFCEPAADVPLFLTAFDEISFDLSQLDAQVARVDLLWIHKMKSIYKFAYLLGKIKMAVYVHDHDYYCYRRHKYFPITRRNCTLKSNGLHCFLCGKMSRGRMKWSYFKANLAFLNQVDDVMVGSEFMRKESIQNGIDAQKITVLPPLIYLGKRLAIKHKLFEEKNILFVGQMIKGKGVDLLLEAFSKMKMRTKCRLTLVGTGDDLSHCQMLAIQKKLANNVYFMGYVRELEPFYQAADIFAFPSRWQEPFGMSGPEAMSRGIPVVGFNVGGVSEWLKHQENGLLVPPNDVDAFANALDCLLNDNDYNKKLGDCAAENMGAYTPEVFVEKCLSIFKEGQK